MGPGKRNGVGLKGWGSRTRTGWLSDPLTRPRPQFNHSKTVSAAVWMTARPARVLRRYRGAALPDPSNQGERERIPHGES